MGFTGLSLEIIELDRVLPGFILFHWALLGFTGFYWVLLGFQWVLLGFSGF